MCEVLIEPLDWREHRFTETGDSLLALTARVTELFAAEYQITYHADGASTEWAFLCQCGKCDAEHNVLPQAIESVEAAKVACWEHYRGRVQCRCQQTTSLES